MLTTAHIDLNLALNVVFEGQPPTNTGMVSFPCGGNSRLPVLGGHVRAHRIKYADLAISGDNARYQIALNYSTPDGVNPVGDPVYLGSGGSFFYLRTNLQAATTGSVPIPAIVNAGVFILIGGSFDFKSPVPDNDGDLIIGLTWSTAGLATIGQDKFYCDIILY